MAYVLSGVIGRVHVLENVSPPETWRAVGLRQGLLLLAIVDGPLPAPTENATDTPFRMAPASIDQVLGAWSVDGPVAYVEAEYFGGLGYQGAVVWQDGRIVLGPLTTADDSPVPDRSPISLALRHLGVSATGYVDEFAAVGLDRHRQMDEWTVGPASVPAADSVAIAPTVQPPRIVAVGEWIYAGSVLMPVYIVQTDFDFWYELATADGTLEIDDVPGLDGDGQAFYVSFHGPPAGRSFWPDSETLDSITAAKATAESRLPSPVAWS